MSTSFNIEFYAEHGISNINPLSGLGAGDSFLLLDVLSDELQNRTFEYLDDEIDWNVMTHKGGPVPRLISIQGDVDADGCVPLYRHPADEQPATIPFTSYARKCRDEVSAVIGQQFNHTLIQKYRSGHDNISEHADKTLDIKRGTTIVNLSIGATRVMILRSKSDCPTKIVQKITLPANSLFVMGWQTNLLFTHSIKTDKRMPRDKRPDEQIYHGQRISLTFRNIATFVTPTGIIFGQGATTKEPTSTKQVSSNEEECTLLLKAFGVENHCSCFDWDQYYGQGFDVVNFQTINH